MSVLRFEWSRSAIRPVCIGGLLVSAGTLGAAMLASAPVAARDDEPPKVGRTAPEPGPSSPIWRLDDFDREARQRIRKLAEDVLAALTPDEDLEKKIRDLVVEQQAKESAYEKAKLAREVAEIELRAYTEGIALQEAVAINEEIQLAKKAVGEARVEVEDVKKEKAKNAAASLGLHELEDKLKVAQLTLEKKQFGREVVENKLQIQNLYTKPKRTKELQSEVEKARAEELIQLQTFKLAGDELERLKRKAQFDKKAPASEWASVVRGLEESIRLENELRSVLNQGAPAAVGESLKWFEKGVSLANRLRAVLGKAEQLRDDLDMKPILRKLGASIPTANRTQPPKSEE